MKLFKYLFVFVVILAVGISIWFYYPQFQIYKLKKHAVEVRSETYYVSYINYYRHSKASHLSHLAIGDSVVRGFGAEKNKDFVYQFSNKLGSQIHQPIEFKNEGINGITSGELKQLVQEGKFDDEIKKSDIVTINVGGNDILDVAARSNLQSLYQTFTQLQTTFSNNLSDIATHIKIKNPNATIIFLELYNPLSPSEHLYPIADKLLPKWNLKIYEVASHYSNSMVIETTKAINGKKLDNLSKDGVHPNSAGYTAISEQMIYQFKHEFRKKSV